MAGWSFLTNHALVMSYIAHHPRTTAREMAEAIGITERTVRKIIADLLASGYITTKREGRRTIYGINPDLPLLHPSHGEAVVRELLVALGWKEREYQPELL